MKKIAEVSTLPLKWVQPKALKMEYELHSDGELAGTLRFRSSFGSFATGESEDGCWTFKRIGFWQTQVTVRTCGEDTNLAVFRHNTWNDGGTLELATGKKYRLTSNLWETRLEFLDEAGWKPIQLHSSGLLHLSASVSVHPDAIRLAQLPWMVMFACYLMVMMQMDSTTAAVV